MSNRSEPIIQEVTVLAVVTGRGFTLLDRQGHMIGATLRATCLNGPIEPRMAEPHLWRLATARMAATSKRYNASRRENAWLRRADSLAKSFQIRGRDRSCPHSRQRFERYSTSDWPQAVSRMYMQGINAARYHSRSGWQRWANTVANNHNKRKGGRYAAASYGDRENDHGND